MEGIHDNKGYTSPIGYCCLYPVQILRAAKGYWEDAGLSATATLHQFNLKNIMIGSFES